MLSLPYYKEKWIDIPGYEGLYQVSNFIKVMNVITGNLKKLSLDRHGYLTVRLWKNNQSKLCLIHRLIAETFIPNPGNKPCIDHINTIRTDNRIENLRWVTHKENQNNYLTKYHLSVGGKGKHKNRKDLSKPVYKCTLDNQIISEYPSLQEAARQNGIPATNICKNIKGKYKSAGGYIWKYKD